MTEDNEVSGERRYYRLVARVGKVRISTAFLGEPAMPVTGAPRMFETMVFGGTLDEQAWHYATWEEAEAGHAQVVELVRSSHKQRGRSFWRWLCSFLKGRE